MKQYRYGRIGVTPGEEHGPEDGYEVFAYAGLWIAEDSTGVVACPFGDLFANLWPDQFDGTQEEAEALDDEATAVALYGDEITIEEAWQRMGADAKSFAKDFGWPLP